MEMEADVLIVGTGIAGMYSALNLREDLKIVMITKSNVEECNTYLAQGGISTARNEDDYHTYIEDTLKAGTYKNNIEAVKVLVEESIENINKLVSLGVKFDMDGENFDYTREGAHRVNRIVHCSDKTGQKVFEVLLDNVKSKKNINIIENACLLDLITLDNNCCGGIVRIDNEIVQINSKITILASGGIGGLFKNSTNQRTLTGDGISIAIKNDIEVVHMDYIQFHPTALYEGNLKDKRFLITESLRGEGAYLLNNEGDRFVDELLPRDVVSKAILEEERRTNSEYVFLDITHKPKDFIINRFPLIYNECKKRGIDITKDRIPVTPAQHYFMGGIKVDTDSKTSMNNLFACGEVSCTGVHGSNRLASNSLLEGLVFSNRAAECINRSIDDIDYVKGEINIKMVEDCDKYNNHIIVEEIIKVRGDMKNELVGCR